MKGTQEQEPLAPTKTTRTPQQCQLLSAHTLETVGDILTEATTMQGVNL